MKEKIHDLKTALEVLRIEQTVSFDDCQKLMTDMHEKTGFVPPNFELSGNQWCALVNLAVARFGNTTPPQRKESEPVAVYGYCPECGAKGVIRERRLNGNDICAIGHTYPSREAATLPQPKEQKQKPMAWIPIEQMYPQTKSIDILMGDGSILCAVLPQFNGDLWWEGSGTGEKFIDPKYANVTHWRIHGETTTPPQRKPWVSMSEEDREQHRDSWRSNIHDQEIKAIEAKLRELNEAPQLKPLTDEQFQAIKDSLSRQEGWDGEGWDLALKEAIEAAHGIKE